MSVKIFDQVPITIEKDIKIEVNELSGAKHKNSTGMVTWKYNLKPEENKTFKLNYEVKYPKYMNLVVL